jgi:hypothetical protein
MPKITIFRDTDFEQDILDKLINEGLVGISGGRLAVRAKLEKVQDLIDTEKLEGYWAKSTLNHPDTELGYGYDENRYNMQEAQKLITESYN